MEEEASASPSLGADDNLQRLVRDGRKAKTRLLRLLGMKPPAAEEKKMKLVKRRITQALIDYMMVRPYNPVPVIPDEKLAKRSQEFREGYAERKAISDKIKEYEQELIKQYLTKGYAEEEFEVTDDEDNDNEQQDTYN